jgi:hypothetical protein
MLLSLIKKQKFLSRSTAGGTHKIVSNFLGSLDRSKNARNAKMLSVTPQILAKQKTDTEYKAAGQALSSEAPGKIRWAESASL